MCTSNFAAKNRFEELDPKLRDLRLGDKETLKFNMVIGKDVELLAKAMELSQAEIDQIRMEAQFSAATQIHKIFTKWRYRYGNKATLGLLTRTLEEAQMYGAAVDWEKYDYAVGILSQAVAQNPNYVKQMSTWFISLLINAAWKKICTGNVMWSSTIKRCKKHLVHVHVITLSVHQFLCQQFFSKW